MSDRPRRRRALTPEQEAESFDTNGLDFDAALAQVLAGGPDVGNGNHDTEREADK